jgi:predicted membrane protein
LPSAMTSYFLELVDACLIEGTYTISAQAILFLICTIFNKIYSKKLKVRLNVIMEHLILWKRVAL